MRLYVGLPRSREEVEIVGHQLLRAGTSVAAHTREASRARSDAEFCSQLDGALQEADEAQLWLALLNEECKIEGDDMADMLGETHELIAILVTMSSKTKQRA